MNKVFENFEWKNYPNEDTPLNEGNLNKINDALNEVDDRIIVHDNTKASKEEILPLIKEISFNEENGIFTITRKNGSKFIIDTKLEKIAVNFTYNPTTQQIILTLDDGTKQYIDLSALITQYEFLDTDTVSFFVDGTGKVSAIVKEGSIEEKHLRPNYLAEIKVEAVKAEKSAAKSESFAHGGTGTRPGEDTDNAEYYSEKSKEYADSWKGSLLPQGAISFSQLPTSGNVAGHLYNITNAFVSDDRFKDGEGYSYPAGTNVYWTQDEKWDCLSGILTKEVTQAEYDALSSAEKLNGTIYYISDADNSMSVDSALSTTSVNPVQNKIITQALNQEIDRAKAAETEGKDYTNTKIADLINGAPSTLDTLGEIADAMENNQNVVEALNAAIGNKVDKINGKGLSTNDFTDEFKNAIGEVKWKTITNWGNATETGFYKLGSDQFGIVRGGDKNINNTNFLQVIFHPEFIEIRGGYSYGGMVNWTLERVISENVQSDWNETNTVSDAYIKNKPTIPAPVAVKGDTESTYRTGNVNITSGNIGAMPTSGGEFTGDVTFDKYMAIKAWPNYGTGVAKAWYNANTKTLDFEGGVLNIDLNATSATNADTVDGKHASSFVDKSGDAMSGMLQLTKGSYVYTIPSNAYSGWVKFAEFEIKAMYSNYPITFTVTRRGLAVPININIMFESFSNLDPTLLRFLIDLESQKNLYALVKLGTSKWALYTNVTAWCYTSIVSVYNGPDISTPDNQRVEITYTYEEIASLPTGYIYPEVFTSTSNNSKTSDGVVSKGSGNVNCVYMTDDDGNPNWKNYENMINLTNNVLISMENSKLTFSKSSSIIYNNIGKELIIKGCVNINVNSDVGDSNTPFIMLFRLNDIIMDYDFDDSVYVLASIIEETYAQPKIYNVGFSDSSGNNIYCGIYGAKSISGGSKIVFNFTLHLPRRNV